MNWLNTLNRDKYLQLGWGFVLLSAALFCVPLLLTVTPDQYLGFFAAHYGLVAVYHTVLFYNKDRRDEENRIHYRLVKLVLLLISAYALNREMAVFAASPLWFSVVLVLLCANALLAVVYHRLPRWAQNASAFVHGLGFAVFAYLAIYLLPLYAISVPGMLVLGVSLHTFVPLLFCIVIILLLTRLAAHNRRCWVGFCAGLVAAFLFCTAYAAVWDNKLHRLNRHYLSAMAEGEDNLPLWVQVAQGTDRDAVSEAILLTGLVYKIPDWNNGLFWSMPSRNFGERQPVHDPLVTIASLFSGNVLLSPDDRIKILESQYNQRHQTLERLWSGENLRTANVSTNVKVWPATHIAYTEKTLTVFNHQNPQRWRTQGEGIYTFHLPEGGVVNSLSLWINGKEEKGILTTKEKASTAYRTIVGYERRDPSVVHWQEGNTVSVRVFPVLAGESRTFKIGVTAPLLREGGQLVYENLWFEGPDARNATETVVLQVADDSGTPLRQASLSASGAKRLTRSGRYQPRWTVAFAESGLSPQAFSFNGRSYTVQPYKPQRVPAVITDVYLDVNSAWSDSELDAVWRGVQQKRVWVYSGGRLQAVKDDNKEELFDELRRQSFSLFPFYLVKHPETAAVVTKSDGYSPSMADLAGSPFLHKLQGRMNSGNRVRLFQLGTTLSPYIRSLKERRCFDFEAGSTAQLAALLRENRFVQDVETDNEVIVHSAGIVISRQEGELPSAAPDHLMRLFAYNHILQQMGTASATDSTALVKEAEEAYVVTPVSSLVVLETAADYDRFDIKDGGNNLKNASLKNNGAVPEPGEWAIIIVFGLALLFFITKTRLL